MKLISQNAKDFQVGYNNNQYSCRGLTITILPSGQILMKTPVIPAYQGLDLPEGYSSFGIDKRFANLLGFPDQEEFGFSQEIVSTNLLKNLLVEN